MDLREDTLFKIICYSTVFSIQIYFITVIVIVSSLYMYTTVYNIGIEYLDRESGNMNRGKFHQYMYDVHTAFSY